MPKLTGSLTKYPARASFLWYGAIIVLGGALLTHPLCRVSGADPITLLDGLFTATSAACVTGLTVRSTGSEFSLAGQWVILILVQLGGIGIMTVTTFVMFQLGRPESLRQRALVVGTIGGDAGQDLRWILRSVLLTTLAFEAAGFVLLAGRNLLDQPPGPALWHALFHSVAAFCNAGFGLYDDSLTRYQGDLFVNLTVAGLIVGGGIGFPVLLDIQRTRGLAWADRWDRLHVHSKIMLLGTAALLSVGMLASLLLESDGVLKGMPWGRRLMVSGFHSVTCRTAGFNTIDVASLSDAMLLISIVLMMIGAGPCSTAGGFKVSTVMVLVLHAWNAFLGRTRTNFYRRTIPRETVERATATAMLFGVAAVAALTTLLVCEQSARASENKQVLFLDASFEVASALGTVGLSTGMTPHLTSAGRLVIIVLMFLGRLGPISVFVALSRSERRQVVEYPDEEPMIG